MSGNPRRSSKNTVRVLCEEPVFLFGESLSRGPKGRDRVTGANYSTVKKYVLDYAV